MKRIIWLFVLVPLMAQGRVFKVGQVSVNYDKTESYQVVRAIGDLKHDIDGLYRRKTRPYRRRHLRQ